MEKLTLIDATLWSFQVGQEKELSATQRAFLQALIQVWNETGRRETFYAANSVIKKFSGISSHSCILRAKSRLRDEGIIELQSGLGSRASEYTLLFGGMTPKVTRMTPKVTRMTPKVTRMTPKDIQVTPRVTKKEKEYVRDNKRSPFLNELLEIYPRSSTSNLSEIEKAAESLPEEQQADVLNAIDNLIHSDEWQGEQAKFIPGLEKFLKEKRWKGREKLPIHQLNPEKRYYNARECWIRFPGWREVVAALKGCDPADLRAGDWREFVTESGQYMTREYTQKKKSLVERVDKDD